jgi:hypothetical protein
VTGRYLCMIHIINDCLVLKVLLWFYSFSEYVKKMLC